MVVCILLAPIAKAASLILGGTAFKEALAAIIIVGNVIRDKVIPPTSGVDLGKLKTANKTPRPSKPNTIDGTAAKLLMFTSIKSVNLFFWCEFPRDKIAS
jgi:hypothetical protein